MRTIHFILPAIAPFRLDLTVWALKRRDRNIVDQWDGTQYSRVFSIENIAVKALIEQQAHEPHILVKATSLKPIKDLETKLADVLVSLLGLNVNLKNFYKQAKQDPILFPLVQKFKGLKPPRFPTLFEALTNAIACQQLSLEAGLTILNHFVQLCGKPFQEKNQTLYAFPEPKEILQNHPDALMKLGFSRNKSETLLHLATEFSKHEDLFRNMEDQSNDQVIETLTAFKGIGRWSAEYVLLRGLGRLEVIPGDDVGVQRNILRILKMDEKPNYSKMKELEQQWSPYAGLIYFHLLLQNLFKEF